MKAWMIGAAALVMAGAAQAEVVVDSAEYSEARNVYSLTVTNEYDEAVSRIELKLTYITPGRSVPWAEQNQRISVPGGIEPGETRELSGYFAPHQMRDAAGRDVVIETGSVTAYGADGEPID